MKILVSGGAGFIGSHLVDHLLAEGHEVMIVDNAGSTEAGNLEHHSEQPRLRKVNHDIAQPLPASVRRFKPQRIYNLACSSGPAKRRRDPVSATITCVNGTRNLLDLARDCDARFLQGSSGGVYGDPAVHPQPESYLGNVDANSARAPHDEAKRLAETLCRAFKTQHGLDVRVARIFSTYGPRMHAEGGRVISNFVTQALSSDDLTVYGDGTQTRCFCYVDDMVRGLVSLMESEDPRVAGPINLGSAEEQTLLQLAERVLRLTGSQSRLRHVGSGADDAHRRRADIALAEDVLGWRPRVPLQQGLQSTVEYFRRQTPIAVHSQ
ncbi:SDR family oxidoreductase [soil metagenome]